MAIEIQVIAQVVETEPVMPGNPGIVMREMQSRLLNLPGGSTKDAFALGRAQLRTVSAQVIEALDEDLSAAEEAAPDG
jgi:hypothetical protein